MRSINRGRALVTGGSGFIGHHLVAALRARGEFVRVLDLARPIDHVPDEFIQASIGDRDAVREAMEGIDCVYHLAARTHLWAADKDDYDHVNHVGTDVALSVAREKRVSRFVHCSTDAILFGPDGAEQSSDESACPTVGDMAGRYTRSKLLAEQSALGAARRGLPVTIVNPTVPIGPGDHSLTPPTATLSLFVRRPPLFILDCTLNLVDVRDVVEGILLAAQQGRVGERYILGGENIRLRDLAGRVGRLVGRNPIMLPIPGAVALAAGKAAEWSARTLTHKMPVATEEGVRLALRARPVDIRKARNELGYAPRSLNRSLPEAVAWVAGRLGLDPAADAQRPHRVNAARSTRPAA
jgi:dihydroflavonol-4-reductase